MALDKKRLEELVKKVKTVVESERVRIRSEQGRTQAEETVETERLLRQASQSLYRKPS